MLGLSRLGYSLAVNRQIPSRGRPPAPDARDAGGDHRRRRACWRSLLLIPADLEFLAAIYAFGATIAFTIVAPVGAAGCAAASPTATARTGCRSTCASAAASCRCPAVLGALMSAARVRRAARLPRRRALGRRSAGWRSASRSTSATARPRASRSQARDACPRRRSTRARRRGRVRLDPRAGPRHAARRRHHADRRPARRRGERGRRRGRRGDRGAVGLRGADGAAARRARARRRAQARAQGAGARQGGGGGVRGRRGRHRDRARPPRRARRSCARPSAAASRRSCWPPRSRRACAAACCSAASRACTTRSWARRRATCVNKAPCRVILTAPPRRDGARRPDAARAARSPAPARAIRWRHPGDGGPTGAGSLESAPMFVLVVGAGRVGSSVATSALRAGHTVSVLDEDPLSHERLDVELGQSLGGGRRALHDRHRARDRRADRGRASRRPTCSSPPPTATTRTSSSRRSPSAASRSPRVIARVLDPRRAAWYSEQGVQTICPTQIAIEQLEQAALAESADGRALRDHRRRRQGRLEPRARAAREGPRGDRASSRTGAAT